MRTIESKRPSPLLFLIFLVGTVTITFGQTHKPAIEYRSLMNVRYYEANGSFLVGQLQLVFPPASLDNATFVIAKAGGEVVGRVPLRYQPLDLPAFGLLYPVGTGRVSVGQPGDYLMWVLINGQQVTSLPFSLKVQKSSDPFDPVTRFVREGPYDELAYLSVTPNDPKSEVRFNWWMSLREVPAGMKRPKVTIHLLVNGKEIATSRSGVVPSLDDWQFFRGIQLMVRPKPPSQALTLADLTRNDGEIEVVVKAAGQTVKSYKTRAVRGQLQRLPRNRLETEPHHRFISPRFLEMTGGGTLRDKMFEMYWVSKISERS